MKLPAEASLHALGYLDRQTLGRMMVANRRLGGIVNRHRKTLNLPEIPIPPRLSAFLKCLVILAAVTLVLAPVGFSYAKLLTRRRLGATDLVPESFHDVQQYEFIKERTVIAVPCTTTCDSRLQCRAECAFQYTLLDERKGRITQRNCSSTGLSSTNASLDTHVGWNCSFDYAVNEATVNIEVEQVDPVEWHLIAWPSVLLAMLALTDVLLLLRVDRRIGDAYMAATSSTRHDRIRGEHEDWRKRIIRATVAAFIFAGICGSAALCGMTFQSFQAVDIWFFVLVFMFFVISSVVVILVLIILLALLWDQR